LADNAYTQVRTAHEVEQCSGDSATDGGSHPADTQWLCKEDLLAMKLNSRDAKIRNLLEAPKSGGGGSGQQKISRFFPSKSA
jgi:hypothetical protein